MGVAVVADVTPLSARVESYRRAYAEWPASWPSVHCASDGREFMQGVWSFGQDYRNDSQFFGAYPGDYLDRLQALFPEHALRPGMLPLGTRVLHAFSGSLPAGPYDRCDIVQPAEFQCDVRDVGSRASAPYDFIAADPPYSDEDAQKYKAPPLNRLAYTTAMSTCARVGAHMAWLDTVWPQHNKDGWITIGWIYIQRSTNHRIRLMTLFERAPEQREASQ